MEIKRGTSTARIWYSSPPVYWFISGLAILIAGLLSLINLSEWYTVSIQKDFSAYPFNGEGPVPYYYKSPDLYSSVTLIWGLFFLALWSYLLWTIVKRQKSKTLIAAASIVFALTIQFVHGRIGTG